MKRINLILFTIVLPLIILYFGVAAVAAKGGSERVPSGTTVTISEGNIMATALSTMTLAANLDYDTAVIYWGDGTKDPADVYEKDDAVTLSGTHLYNEAGQYEIVVIAVMPDVEQPSASIPVNVMAAQETIDWLIEHVVSLELDRVVADGGESLINQLDAAQAALGEGQPEAAVEALEAYLNELAEYIDADLVPKEDPSKTVADDMAYFLLADPRPSP